MNTKKNVFLWASYDFANSLVMIVFFLYFAQWIVVDRGVSDFHFNLTFTISALALLITVPLTGSLLDKSLRRITGLRYTTMLTALFYVLCGWYAVSNNNMMALIFFTLGLYMYLLSFTFYTPLLNDIARPERRGFVSGIGISANYVGQFVGLLIALPFSNGSLSFFGGSARAETLLPSAIAFFVFSLPMLFFFHEPKKESGKFSFGSSLRDTLVNSKILFTSSGTAFFLLAYFLFNDGILTVVNNFPIFLEQVWQLSDTVKTYLMLGVLVTCAIGGTLSGIIADKIGHKKAMMFILIGWAFVFPFIGLVSNFTFFVILTVILGLWYGSSWAVSRSLMGHVAPKGKHNLAFAYFGLAERASSLLGPVVWGLVVSNLVHLGSYRYRIAMVVMTAFIILGFIALLKVKDEKTSEQESL